MQVNQQLKHELHIVKQAWGGGRTDEDDAVRASATMLLWEALVGIVVKGLQVVKGWLDNIDS
jgi:hypothetical protein